MSDQTECLTRELHDLRLVIRERADELSRCVDRPENTEDWLETQVAKSRWALTFLEWLISAENRASGQ